MVEANQTRKKQSKRKTYAPVAFGSKIFFQAQHKMSNYLKEIWQSTWHFLSLHTFRGKQQNRPSLWHHESVTRFSQTKAIPPALLNASDYVWQFKFEKAHIAGLDSSAGDFPARLALKVAEKIGLKVGEDIYATPIEVKLSSSDGADEKQFFFIQAICENESEKRTLQQWELSW